MPADLLVNAIRLSSVTMVKITSHPITASLGLCVAFAPSFVNGSHG
jgi:hypothetical protein